MRYTKDGLLRSQRDALGHTSTATFNLADQVVSSFVPATGQSGSGQGHTNYSYTYLGGPLKTTDLYDEGDHASPIRSVTSRYDAEGRSLGTDGGTATDPKLVSTEPVGVTYTSFGALKTLSDGQGHTTRYDYDVLGRVTQIVRPGANETSGADVVRFPSYAADGSLLQSIDGRGVVTNYAYDTSTGDLTGVSYPASPAQDVSLSYDAWGRPTSLSDGSGTHSVTYSDADAPISTTTTYKKADGTEMPAFTLATLYHADGLRAGLAGMSNTASSGISFAYGYDARGMLSSLTNAQGQVSSWTYKANGALQSQGIANGWTRSWTQNALGQTKRLLNVSADGGSGASYGGSGTSSLLYDGAGNLTRETAFLGTNQLGNGTTQYAYDQNDRLSQESSTRWNHTNASYGFDSAYNRTSTSGSTSDQTWSETLASNTKNQILSRALTSNAGNFAYSYDYDDEGNRTGQVVTPQGGTSTTRTFAYDVNDHLTGVTEQVGTATPIVRMTAGYRADGLRAWKQTPQHGRTYFFYDGDALLAEMDESGALTSVSTWGADGLVSKRVATSNGATTRYYAFDPRGNLATRTDAAGVVTDRPLSTAYSGESIQGETTSTFGGQAGGYYDEETGLTLFGQRYYDASMGTWLTRDPIAEAGGINLYSYVQGNPTNFVDPDGLSPNGPYGNMVGISQGDSGADISAYYPYTGKLPYIYYGKTKDRKGNIVQNWDPAFEDMWPALGALAGAGPTALSPGLEHGIGFGAGAIKAPTYRGLQGRDGYQSHHIIQDATVDTVPCPNDNAKYSRSGAPAVQLRGGSHVPGSPRDIANAVQRERGGGTYGAERRIGYKALRKAGGSSTTGV